MEEILVKQKELYLVPFPFSDFSGDKVRPVIVISNDFFNKQSDDVIICGITTNLNTKNTIILSNKDLKFGKLFSNCCIKVENILKINKKLLLKNIGETNKNVLDKLVKKLNLLL